MSSPGEGGTLSFKRDIKPMFREKDRDAMLQAFDLFDYDDVVGVLDDVPVIEQVKGSQHRVPVLRPEQRLDVPLEAELAAFAR